MTAKDFRELAARSGLTDEKLARHLGIHPVDVIRFKYAGGTGRKIERQMGRLGQGKRPRSGRR